jgi:hypothetical protein
MQVIAAVIDRQHLLRVPGVTQGFAEVDLGIEGAVLPATAREPDERYQPARATVRAA